MNPAGSATISAPREDDMAYKEYKLIHVAEGGCGTIFLGASGLPLKKIEVELNKQAAEGWQMAFMVLEQKRFWLFWQREAAIITLGR